MGSEDLRCAMNESREGALPLPQGKTEFVERVIPRELSCPTLQARAEKSSV
jgi:hypothetical protein